MAEEKITHPLLSAFKERMRIFHDGEDGNLSLMLESSCDAVERLIGDGNFYHPQVRELVLERARYVYNDQVEFFYENFKGDILGMSLDGIDVEDTDED